MKRSGSMKENGLIPVQLSGGKRTNIGYSEVLDDWDWWVGWGKDESCQFEGSWESMAILAAKILRHENTAKVAPNLHVILELTEEQEEMY